MKEEEETCDTLPLKWETLAQQNGWRIEVLRDRQNHKSIRQASKETIQLYEREIQSAHKKRFSHI